VVVLDYLMTVVLVGLMGLVVVYSEIQVFLFESGVYHQKILFF